MISLFKLSFLADTDYFAVIGLVKVSMLLLYLRGFLATRRKLRYLVFGLIIYVVLSHFLVILLSLISTIPLWCVWKDWGTDEEAKARNCRAVVDDTEFTLLSTPPPSFLILSFLSFQAEWCGNCNSQDNKKSSFM